MQSAHFFPIPQHSALNMSSFYNGVPHSSNVSEVSTAPPSPVSCGITAGSTTSATSASRFGTLVPNRVFVGGIPSNTTDIELQEVFSQFGNIQEIKIISDKGGVCKGYGFVTFETEEEAKKVQHQDSIILKERRLNIAPAFMKQQPYARPYDMAPPAGSLLYHNGTPFTFHNGMAFFPSQSPQSPYTQRDAALYAASPFGPGQTTSNPSYPQIMYAPYSPPMPYLAAGQQYPYPMSFEYYKPVGPSSQYIYAQPTSLNGALNTVMNGLNSSQSPSPGYGPPSAATGPSGAEIYYNGVGHPASLPLPQTLYAMETSSHQEDWNPELRQAHTPVVSLLKLHEEGSVEELEITRTPKKSFPPGSGGPRPRSRRPGRPAPSPTQGTGRGRGTGTGSLAGQRSASSPHLPSTPNSCLHRSTSLSPSNQVSPPYNGGRQNQLQNHHHHHHPPQQNYNPRRGGPMRGSGPKAYTGNARSNYHNSSHNSAPNQILGNVHNSGQNLLPKPQNTPKISEESVNGVKGASADTPSLSENHKVDVPKQEKVTVDSGAGDASTGRHPLPLSPPNTPLPQDNSASVVSASGASDGEMCQKLKALAL